MKRKISKSQYSFLKQELAFLQQQGKLDEAQREDSLSLYETKGTTNFVRILLVFGSVLVGIGILSFIAGNWNGLAPFSKFFLLITIFLASYLGGFMIEPAYEKTSRSLYYIGAAIYGAGIFLIGQTFHLQHTVYTDFLLWAIGILPLVYYLRDQFLAVFASVFLIIYSFSAFTPGSFGPYWLLLLLPILFWMNEKRMGRKSSLFVMAVLLAATFVVNMLEASRVDELLSILIVFAGGVLLVFYPFRQYRTASSWIGSILFGITGIMLTIPFFWKNVQLEAWAPYLFAAGLIALLIYLLRKDSLPAILITCALIYRYYTDITYDFMPKSLFFVIGGILLIAFGFWFEKSRRGTVKQHEE